MKPEARGVAGLDAVDALDAAEQVVMVADRLSAPIERRGREITVVAREALLDGAAERGLVARGRDLLVVGKAVGVAVDRLGHAERARLARHHRGEVVLVAGDRFRDHHSCVIGGAGDETLDRVLDADGLAGTQVQLGRILIGGVLRHRHLGVELHPAGLQALEQQIERHDLGERGGVADSVGARCLQHGAGIAVDDDRCEFRAGALGHIALHPVVRVIAPVTPCLGSIGGEDHYGGDRKKPENANPRQARGRQVFTKHETPSPFLT
ncbi:hypothetical protein ACVMGC_010470 [Bradyrhizobium barranii subsp. barranii]